MVNKTSSFKKKGKGKKGNFKNDMQVVTPMKKPGARPSVKLSASAARKCTLEAELPQILSG